MFPIILPTDLIKFYSLFNLSIKNKKLYVLLPFSSKFLFYSNFFKKLGLIKSFFILTNKKIKFLKICFFFYKNLPILNYIKLISTSSKIFTISYISLRLLSKKTKNSLFLLSTSKGLIAHRDALKIKIGGKILFQITF
jgi:ribosomal protein S8